MTSNKHWGQVMQRLALAVASIAALLGTQASAADIPIKAPPPVAPPVSDWTGMYAGLQGGYGWGKQSADGVTGDPYSGGYIVTSGGTVGQLVPPVPQLFFPTVDPSVNQTGGLFGGFFGAQRQWGNWVLGIEGDIDGANIRGSDTSKASSTVNTLTFIFPTVPVGIPICSGGCLTLNHDLSIDSKIDALASLRGKVGWSFAPNWLIYGTGGAAFAHSQNSVTSTESATVVGVLPNVTVLGCCSLVYSNGTTPPPRITSGGTTMLGWALGGGMDWKLPLNAGSALVFGVELLHYGFPEQTFALSNNAGGFFVFKAKENVDTIKGRISYLFSIL
jgi:outer membrane immunogenic protein